MRDYHHMQPGFRSQTYNYPVMNHARVDRASIRATLERQKAIEEQDRPKHKTKNACIIPVKPRHRLTEWNF
jgi:hypothetical protein